MPVHREMFRLIDPTLQLTENPSLSRSAKHFPNHYQQI